MKNLTEVFVMVCFIGENTFMQNFMSIFRFIGTTPDSSSIAPLLKSLISQIRQTYGLDKATSEVNLFH